MKQNARYEYFILKYSNFTDIGTGCYTDDYGIIQNGLKNVDMALFAIISDNSFSNILILLLKCF